MPPGTFLGLWNAEDLCRKAYYEPFPGFYSTADAGYVGLDSFLYRAFDGVLYSALAAVTIHVLEADPGEIPPPGGDDDCGHEAMSMLAMDDAGDGVIDSLVDGDVDHDLIDDVMADESWLT